MNKNILYIVVGVALVIILVVLLKNRDSVSSHGNKTKGALQYFSADIVGLPEAVEASIVELKNGDTYELKASYVKKVINGSVVRMLGYNGSIPGPTITVPQGAAVTINFTNDTDIETTVHSHGIRSENQYDGVPDVTQKPVKPGEMFAYKLKFPDAGVYWYHPHMREDYAQELGLHGNFIVTPTNAAYWSPVNREATLTLDDILLQDDKIAAFNTSHTDHALMGRFGNTTLVNGSANYAFEAKQGEVVRFYITNTANTRVFNFSITNAKMKLVGGDNGKYEYEQFTDSVLLAPSERVIVEVLFDTAGIFTLEHHTPDRTYTLGKVNVSSNPIFPSYVKEFQSLRTNADTIAGIEPFRSDFIRRPDKILKLTVDIDVMGNIMGSHGQDRMSNGEMMDKSMMDNGEKIEWEDNMAMMNKTATPDNVKWKIIDAATDKSGMDIDWKFQVGDKVKIRITNDARSLHPMQHPIHFHGQRFLVLATNGLPNNNLVWKDTVLVQKGDTVDILVDMSNAGTWMAHCHIAEHLEAGMMLPFTVVK
jgi:suppressor of ftsI